MGDKAPSAPASPGPSPRTSTARRGETAARNEPVRDRSCTRTGGAFCGNRRAAGTATAVDEHLAERCLDAAGPVVPARAGRNPAAHVP